MQTSVRQRSVLSPESLPIPECLFAENLGLVGKVLSCQFARLPAADLEESEAWGRLGLWSAATRFDPALGFAFSTYAVRTIRGYILRGLTRGNGRNPPSCLSLDAPSPGMAEGTVLGELLADPKSGIDAVLDRASLVSLVSALPPRERELITLMYGEDKTLQEVADAWGRTRQRTGQIHLKALRRLRETLTPSAFGI